MARRGDDTEEAPPRSDVYTGLLVISLGAMITGCVLLYLDYSEYPDKKPDTSQLAPLRMQPGPAAPAQPNTGAKPPDKPAEAPK